MNEDLDQLLLLIKRLNKISHEDILLYVDRDEETLQKQLLTLINQGKIERQENNYLFLSVVGEKKLRKSKCFNKNLSLMLRHHDPETVMTLVKYFCAEIPSTKASFLIDLSPSGVLYFYNIFKKLIYLKQHNTLVCLYEKNPKKCWIRNIFDIETYYYMYNNNVYISKKPLISNRNENIHKTEERHNFKVIFSYIRRLEQHNKNKEYLSQNIAVKLWRRNKELVDLKNDLENLINLNIS